MLHCIASVCLAWCQCSSLQEQSGLPLRPCTGLLVSAHLRCRVGYKLSTLVVPTCMVVHHIAGVFLAYCLYIGQRQPAWCRFAFGTLPGVFSGQCRTPDIASSLVSQPSCRPRRAECCSPPGAVVVTRPHIDHQKQQRSLHGNLNFVSARLHHMEQNIIPSH